MNTTRLFNKLAACSLAVALTGTTPTLLAAQPETPPQSAYNGWGWGMGPGMMGGYGMGPGMMGGYGMGPGMMGGYGMGPGMMGGYGMGPGMMGGYGMGPGMMGGYGMGPGMMGGYGWGRGLDLTEEQQTKINQIQDQTRKEHWSMMGAMMDQQAKLRDLYAAPKQDAAAIDKAYKAFGKLQQQMYDSSVESQKRIEAVLTKEQQEKLRNYWRKGPAPAK